MMDLSSDIYSQGRNKLRKLSVKFLNVKKCGIQSTHLALQS